MPIINTRREVLKQVAAISGIGLLSPLPNVLAQNTQSLKGNIHHSVCRWTYDYLPLQNLCTTVKSLGFSAIDLVGPKEWDVLKANDITCSMCNGAEINLVDGFIHPEHHGTLVKNYTEIIPLVAKAGYTNLICFSGNKRGMDAETGLQNAVIALQKLLPLAEKHKVVLQMELFNSKVNHPDYMADNSAWGIELCKRLNSPSFKLLYDIYHMQIMEGNIIETITKNHVYFGHYHTAGVPGRHEINELQELNYPAIMKAIVATDYTGFVAQEFIPIQTNKITSLEQAIRLCDV